MSAQFAAIAAVVLVVAGISRRLVGTPVTPAMVFTITGVLLGPLVINEITLAPTSSIVRTSAETTLAIVLFADAARIDLRALRRQCDRPRLPSSVRQDSTSRAV